MSHNAVQPDVKRTAGATKRLVQFAVDLKYEHLTEEERRAIRRHVLDTIGACLAGSRSDAARIAAAVFEDVVAPGRFSVPGMQRQFDMLTAAFLAGASGHGIELDDGHRGGSTHPGTVVIPALIAACQDGQYDGKAFMTAVAAGYEAQCKISEAIHPRSRQRGFHNTSVVGVFGAAVAVGKLRGLDASTLEHALGIAASSAAGLFAFLHGGGEIKRLHPGHAAREGLLAVLLAERGMTGPTDILESKDGFFAAYSGPDCVFKVSRTPGQAGAPLAITQCYLKPYACCRHVHAALDAILEIRNQHKLAADDMKAIEIGTYAIAAEHAHTGWQEMGSAQMSFPYCAALAAVRGHVDLDDFSESARADRSVLDVTRRIGIAVDAECEQIYPRQRSARVAITTRDGRRHEVVVREPFGSSEKPLPDDAVALKFRDLAKRAMGDARASAIEAALAKLDSLESVAGFAKNLQAG